MVHYIRFLKVPKITAESNNINTVSAVLTITSDLGEIFFPDNLELVVKVVGFHGPDDIIHIQKSTWQRGSRIVKVNLRFRARPSSTLLRMHISPFNQTLSGSGKEVPKIMDAWSASFSLEKYPSADTYVERHICLGDDVLVRIWEETGESIARHIWDAALGCLILFQNMIISRKENDMPVLFDRLSLASKPGKRLNILELGAGCGIAGIALSHLISGYDILLTDLEEAQEILKKNILCAASNKTSSITQRVLSWDAEVDEDISAKPFNLVIVCDCIYNADSDPDLVGMLQKLLAHSPGVKILIATKRRHYSETVFFNLMDEVKIPMIERCIIPLPHHMSNEDMAAPEVEIAGTSRGDNVADAEMLNTSWLGASTPDYLGVGGWSPGASWALPNALLSKLKPSHFAHPDLQRNDIDLGWSNLQPWKIEVPISPNHYVEESKCYSYKAVDFNASNTASTMTSIRTDRVRMIALNHPKPDMSEEDFHNYRRGEHYKAFSSMNCAQENLVKYEQAHRNSQHVEKFKAAGFPICKFDGIAVFEAEKYEKIFACFTNGEYLSDVVPDEERFLDRGRIVLLPCDLVTVIDK